MIRHVLLDVNIVVDICAQRRPHFANSVKALDWALACNLNVWLYTGSVQTIYFVLLNELRRSVKAGPELVTPTALRAKASSLLATFTRRCCWCSALAEDGNVFGEVDPEDAQLINATNRLGAEACLLTRDQILIDKFSRAVAPAEFLHQVQKAPLPRIPFIDLETQQHVIRLGLERRVDAVLRGGNYILGPEVRELEGKLAEFAGCRHAISCASGTDALLMGLMALGVGPGDAVFAPTFTFVATAEVISLLGARPVFVDIDDQTFNIDPKSLVVAIEKIRALGVHRPRCIIPVDLFGLPADYEALNEVANNFSLTIVEDAAQSFGATWKGYRTCGLGHIAATSFFPAKPLGCYGDGGAVFTDDDDLAQKLLSIRVHGQGMDKYHNVRIGLNGRLDTLQAAVLLEKLEIFPSELVARNRIADEYTTSIAAAKIDVKPPTVPPECTSAWAQYSVLTEHRERFREKLDRQSIPTMIYYPTPLHLQPAFAYLGYGEGDFPVAESVARNIFSLPMHPYLTLSTQKRVIDALLA